MDGEVRGTEVELALADIDPRPGNRSPKRVDELAHAIEEQAKIDGGAGDGLLNAVIVRRVKKGRYELVAGERRCAALEKLGRSHVRARVLELDDAGAAIAAASDNLDREDLGPFEEADVYKQLLDSRVCRDPREVAGRLGRTETHVRQRLKLLGLLPAVRKLGESGALELGALLLVAQCSDDVQRQVAPRLENAAAGKYSFKVWRQRPDAPGIVTREAVQEIIGEHTRDLSRAPFLISDANLVPKAGACTACPYNTGRQGALFAALERTDACLRPKCWDEKVDANVALQREADRKAGLKVLSETETKKILEGHRTIHTAPYRAVDEVVDIPGTTTSVPAGKLVDKETPRAIAYTSSGHRVELVPKAAVDAAVKHREKARAKAGPKASEREVDTSYAREERKRKQRIALLKRSRDLAIRSVGNVVAEGKTSIEHALRAVVARAGGTAAEHVCKALGIDATNKAAGGAWKRAIEEHAAALSDDHKGDARVRRLVALVAQLAIAESVETGGYSGGDQATPPELRTFGVDLARLRQAAKAELEAEARGDANPKPTKGVSIRAGKAGRK